MELPSDDEAGPSIGGVPDILAMTHQVLPEVAFKTPNRKRLLDLKSELLFLMLLNVFIWFLDFWLYQCFHNVSHVYVEFTYLNLSD